MFNRQNLRSPAVFFGVGEEAPFYLERVPSLMTSRLTHNVSFFFLNYAAVTALLFLLTLLVSPGAIIGIGLLGGAWLALIRATSEGSVRIKGANYEIAKIHDSGEEEEKGDVCKRDTKTKGMCAVAT